MSQPNNSSTPSTPERDRTERLKELALQLTPSQSDGFLRNLRQRISSGINDQSETIAGLKRRIDDVENAANDPRRRKKDSRNHRHVDEEDVPPSFTPEELCARVRSYGRKFVLLCGLWLAFGSSGDVYDFFQVPLDDEYDPLLRFSGTEDETDERQGQIRELIDILPEDMVESYWTRQWFAKSIGDGMRNQINNTSHRLRRKAIENIVRGMKIYHPDKKKLVKVKKSFFATSESRFRFFKNLLGWKGPGAMQKYPKFDFPILQGNEADKLDYNEFLRHPLLLKVFAALIRGPEGPLGVMQKQSFPPSTTCMQRIYNIRYTTPGAIVTCAIWVIWLFSADDTPTRIGETTEIDYYDLHNRFLDKILYGLRNNQTWARELFRFWDSHLFPGLHGSPFGGVTRTEDEELREELEEADRALMDMPVDEDV
ncbi:hypothetical protein MKEN_00395200 [Mycena kentingensis (nom. inval.)]|nr:hypothetical protein MKEN_00395200 [Mycena kentingensis (nom. inval.)]